MLFFIFLGYLDLPNTVNFIFEERHEIQSAKREKGCFEVMIIDVPPIISLIMTAIINVTN